MDIYPENKTSDFTVHLPKEISLVSQYEVPIAEIFYPNSWNNIDDKRKHNIMFSRGFLATQMFIPPGYYKNPGQLKAQLQESLEQRF